MRDFRDAKAMARALRDTLKAKAIETTHAETLELIAKAFGYEN
jgi:glyoxalase superfamily protein